MDLPGRDWSLLSSDLIALILGALELPDLLASAAACRSWRAAYKADPRLDAAPLFRAPCLAFHSGAGPASTAMLLSLADGGGGGGRVVHRVTIPDPPFLTRYVAGSSRGWLVTADEQSELLLVNPVTRAQVALPPVRTLMNVTSSFAGGVLQGFQVHRMDLDPSEPRRHDRLASLDLKPEEGRFYFYEKVALSSDPTSGDCVVLILHLHDNIISYARVGDARWNLLHAEEFCDDYEDFFHNDEDGLFYAIRRNGEVHTIDLNGPSPVVKVIMNETLTVDDAKYIVPTPWGDILQVSWDDDYVMNADVRTSKIAVYKMDFVEQEIVQVKDLRGYALFMGFNSSFLFLPTEGCSMIKQDCVYHAADLIDYDYIHSKIFAPRRVVEVKLEDGSINDLWPSRNSWSNWPPPVWLTPSCSPCK